MSDDAARLRHLRQIPQRALVRCARTRDRLIHHYFDIDLDVPWQTVTVDLPQCVATEIDFDSTVIAGSSELVASVLAAPALEAWPVDPEDSLAHDGDTLNT